MLQARPTLGVCFLSQPYFVQTAGEMTETKFIWKREEKREMQRTRQSRRARLDETNNARHFCTVLFFFFLKAAASLLWMHNPPPWGTTTQEAWGWANRFLSTIPTLKRTRVYKTKSKTKSKTSKWIKISNWYGRKTWTVVKFLKRWKRMDDILRQKILFF